MRKIFGWLRAVAALVGCLWLLVTCTPLVSWWCRQLAQPWGNCQGDVLIVLGGSVVGGDLIGASSYWRAVYTVRELRKRPYRRVIISGGNGDDGKPIAELMRDFVRGQSIDTAGILVEGTSTSTRENVRESLALLEEGERRRVVLLTSDFHIWRAVRVFRKAGAEVETCPVPDVLKRYGNWELRAGLFVDLVGETAKIGWYRWKGWI